MSLAFPSKTYLRNKRVLIRVDWNVGVRGGRVVDDGGIVGSLKTIRSAAAVAKTVIIVSHLGNPRPGDTTVSLAPIAQYASRILKKKIYFVQDDLTVVRTMIAALPKGSVVCLENIRLYAGERENDARLARRLASLADCYINEAFGESHRKVASMVAIARYLPSFAGWLLRDEMRHLDALRMHPRQPFVVVLGGAKLETKLPMAGSFGRTADSVLLGGGVANTFLAAAGIGVGKSLYDKGFVPKAKVAMRMPVVLLPLDVAVAKSRVGKKAVMRFAAQKDEMILDIGTETVALYTEVIAKAKTVFWSGPMGYEENPVFAKGTRAIARAIAKNTRAAAVVGGGDTVPFVGTAGRHVFVSTGGGAMLEYVMGKKLPGIEALKK